MRYRLAIITMIALSLLAGRPGAAQDDKETQFAAGMQQGDRAITLKQFEDALKAFKRASGLRNKQSAEAHFGMARAYSGLSAPKSAADSCTDALKFVGGDKSLEAAIRNVRGLALFALAERNDDKRLKEAEADFRAVVELTDTIPIAHYNLGFALLRQGRDDDGIQALNVFLATAPNLREAAEARRLIENPRRARVLFAPEFSISTLQGEYVSLEDLRGRVVLVDFWATWCAPCLKATPSLQRLAKKFSADPFTLLAISLDRNPEAWKRYVTEHKMEWPQYLDNGRLAALFKVKPIPTYILIDHEGIVRGTETGYGPNTDGWLDSEIRKLLREAKKVTTGSDGGRE